MAGKSTKPTSALTWLVAIFLLALVAYQVFSGFVLKKVGVPGLFEIEFAETVNGDSQTTGNGSAIAPECDLSEGWKLVQAHRGSVTDALDDVLAFQQLVLEAGCIRQPYTLDLNGKQNLNRFVITVLQQFASETGSGETYHFKEFQTSLDVGGTVTHASWKARRSPGSDESWEVLSE